jgi:hypothetical protein
MIILQYSNGADKEVGGHCDINSLMETTFGNYTTSMFG